MANCYASQSNLEISCDILGKVPYVVYRVILPNRGPNVAYEAFLEMGLQQDMVYTGCRGFF